MAQLILTISIGVISITLIIYLYFIKQQNELILDFFEKNTESISETLKLTIELGASNEQYDALLPVFDWALKDSTLKFIHLLDENNEEIVTYPFDLNLTPLQIQNRYKNLKNSDTFFIKKVYWKSKFGKGELYTGFSKAKLIKLQDDSIFNLTATMLFISIITILLFAAIALGITKPLRKLAEGAEIIADGNEHFRVNENDGGIEIKRVSKSFNRMIDKLTEAQKQRLIEVSKYNSELELKNNKLIELDNEKNEFLGIVAHDLKNPISAISLYSHSIREYAESDYTEGIVNYADMIDSTISSMITLIKDLLDINALESGKLNLELDIYDISSIIFETEYTFKPLASKKQINIISSYDKDLNIKIDYTRIGQILNNLVSNAIKFSAPSKNIYLKAEKNSNNKVIISVKDEGQGIKPEEMNKLFKKFSRLSAKPTGNESSTGLGLSIAYKLTKQMSGSIWCESEVGVGTTFFLEFELTEPDTNNIYQL